MPAPRNNHDTSSQRRIRAIQRLSRRPATRTPIASANGTVNPAYPMNSSGGWMIIAGSWSIGFRPRPSGGATPPIGWNGLAAKSSSTPKKPQTSAMAATATACSVPTRFFQPTAAIMHRIASSHAHSRRLPSCPAHSAASL
jgi:hypothetical protein